MQPSQEHSEFVIPEIRNIIVALDGSKSSLEACRLAALVANGFKAMVTSVCVIPRRISVRAPPPADADARAALEKAASMLSSYEGVATKSTVLEAHTSSVSEALIEYLISERPDLVICGHRGHGGFERMLLGSVSSALASHSPSSVLVAKMLQSEGTTVSLKRILVATDGSDSALKGVGLAISLAKALSSKLTFVNVVFMPAVSYTAGEGNWFDRAMEESREEGKKIASDAAGIAKRFGVDADAKIIDEMNSPVAALTKLAQQGSYDLIVIGTRGLGGFKRLALGSVASGVLHYAHCSVLVAK